METIRKIRKAVAALMCALALGAAEARAQWVVEDPMAILQQLLTDIDLVTSGDLTLERLLTMVEHNKEIMEKTFGTASAFREGATLYADCARLIDMSNRYLRATYNNYNRLKVTYSNMEDWTGRDYAYAIRDAEDLLDSYQAYYENIQRMIATLKSDSRTIEAKREALKSATEEIRLQMAAQTDSVDMVVKSEVYSSALSDAVDALDVWSDSEVESQRRTYGDSVESEKGTSQRAGSVGRLMLVLVILILTIETGFVGVKVMKGSKGYEWAIIRILVAFVLALVVAIAIGRYI